MDMDTWEKMCLGTCKWTWTRTHEQEHGHNINTWTFTHFDLDAWIWHREMDTREWTLGNGTDGHGQMDMDTWKRTHVNGTMETDTWK
jgi:hypothetical protein